MFCLVVLSSLIITSCTQDPSSDEEYRRNRWGWWNHNGHNGGGNNDGGNDDGGNTGSNQAPTVNAGADKTITLPTSSVTLAGTASDANGTIAAYSWTKVSGTGGSIATPTTATTNVTGLTQGTYVFNLKVTDNQGATANDNVTVTVNSTSTPPPPSGGGGVPAGYTLAYQNGFNSSGDISQNQLGQGGFTTSIKSEGAGSFRSMVNGNSASNVSSGWRSEQQYGSTQSPAEGIVEYDCYFQNWGNVAGNGSGHVIQWHPNSSSGSAVLSLFAYEGKFDVVRSIGGSNTHQSGSLMTVASNTWYKLRWEYKFSTGSDGYVRLYINGNLYYSYNGKTTTGGTYLKLGQNRWSWSGGAVNTETVIYYDNLKVYRKS